MNPTEQMKRQQQYKTYVDQKTPRHNLWLNMLRAFLTGGAVCVLGQIIFNLCELQKLSQDDCSNWTSMLLVLISVILTGTGIYPKLAKWGGAGALVPITGFANSVAAPAIEYKKRRPGLWYRMQDLHHRRACYTFMGFSQAGFSACSTGCGDDLIPPAYCPVSSAGSRLHGCRSLLCQFCPVYFHGCRRQSGQLCFYAFSEARYCSVSSTAFAIHWEHGTSGVPVATL